MNSQLLHSMPLVSNGFQVSGAACLSRSQPLCLSVCVSLFLSQCLSLLVCSHSRSGLFASQGRGLSLADLSSRSASDFVYRSGAAQTYVCCLNKSGVHIGGGGSRSCLSSPLQRVGGDGRLSMKAASVTSCCSDALFSFSSALGDGVQCSSPPPGAATSFSCSRMM